MMLSKVQNLRMCTDLKRISIYWKVMITYRYVSNNRVSKDRKNYNFPLLLGVAVVEWLSSLLAEQEVRGSIPGLATWITDIGYLLLPSCDMSEIPLKRLKSSIQPTNQASSPYLEINRSIICKLATAKQRPVFFHNVTFRHFKNKFVMVNLLNYLKLHF